MNSILTTTKKLLGIEEDYEHFDLDIITNINAVFLTLNQLGVGPPGGFSITNKSTTWDEYLGGDKNLESIKIYIALKTRLMFDPPTSSFVIDAMNRQIEEYEWRLNTHVDKEE